MSVYYKLYDYEQNLVISTEDLEVLLSSVSDLEDKLFIESIRDGMDKHGIIVVKDLNNVFHAQWNPMFTTEEPSIERLKAQFGQAA